MVLQEPGEHAALTNYTVYQRDAQTALCVHRNYTANLVDLECNPAYSYAMVTLLPLRKQDPSIHILNIYSSPKLPNITYADIFSKAHAVAGKEPLVIVGDFNAPSPHWCYRREERRGRKLAELISTMGLTILTDPTHPTRIGNSVTRDTCPDLTLTKNIRHADWLNTEETLGSDHCIVITTIRTPPYSSPPPSETSGLDQISLGILQFDPHSLPRLQHLVPTSRKLTSPNRADGSTLRGHAGGGQPPPASLGGSAQPSPPMAPTETQPTAQNPHSGSHPRGRRVRGPARRLKLGRALQHCRHTDVKPQHLASL